MFVFPRSFPFFYCEWATGVCGLLSSECMINQFYHVQLCCNCETRYNSAFTCSCPDLKSHFQKQVGWGTWLLSRWVTAALEFEHSRHLIRVMTGSDWYHDWPHDRPHDWSPDEDQGHDREHQDHEQKWVQQLGFLGQFRTLPMLLGEKHYSCCEYLYWVLYLYAKIVVWFDVKYLLHVKIYMEQIPTSICEGLPVG